VYFNCEVLPLLKGVSEVNPTVSLLVSLLRPPTGPECVSLLGTAQTKAKVGAAAASAAHANAAFSGLSQQPLGSSPARKGG
jgi:hypothetical protein